MQRPKPQRALIRRAYFAEQVIPLSLRSFGLQAYGWPDEWLLTVRVLREDDIFLIHGGWSFVTLQ